MTGSPQDAPQEVPGRELIEAALRRGATALDEAEAKRLFSLYGVPVTPGVVVSTADEAVREATRLGFPVVVKAATERIQHKTEAGLVLLGIATRQQCAGPSPLWRSAWRSRVPGRWRACWSSA